MSSQKKTLKEIREIYGVPARRGAQVMFVGREPALKGRILSANQGVRIQFEGEDAPWEMHPTFLLEYTEK